jgi:RNA polymerase sigma-70 factor (ECF subfamily)
VDDHDRLAEQFEAHRGHLRAVAYRMLGSLSEADDAVQDAWLRLARSDSGDVHNLRGWLTTVVGRVCLDMLRSRKARREEPMGIDVPAAGAGRGHGRDPQDEALLADSVGLALLVVLDRLTPAERLAFVLHDMFAVPFNEIAPVLGRSPTAAKMLASRARRRVRQGAMPDPDLDRQWEIVDAFLAAARDGDLAALVALLDPDVTARADAAAAPPGIPRLVRGAQSVARQAFMFSHRAGSARPALVGGAPGFLVAPHGDPALVLTFLVSHGKIVEIDVVADPARLRTLHIAPRTGD